MLQILAFRIKKLHSSSASISPPNPTSILIGVSWLSGLDGEIIAEVVEMAELVSFESGDVVAEPGQEICYLYVIISGIIQVRQGNTFNNVNSFSNNPTNQYFPTNFSYQLIIFTTRNVQILLVLAW